jgi:hypothetical protein
MHDRPTVDELLEAIGNYLVNDVMPNTEGRVSFHARVANNTVQIIRRELATEEDHLAREWAGLDTLLGREERPLALSELRLAVQRRNHDLVARIRAGDADAGDFRARLLAHLRTTTHDKLTVTNPALAAATA